MFDKFGHLASARSAVSNETLGVEGLKMTPNSALVFDHQPDSIDGTPSQSEQTALLQAFKSGDFEATESLGVSLSERYPRIT